MSRATYDSMAPMPNKFLNPDGTTSTLQEAMGGGEGGKNKKAVAGYNYYTPGALQLDFGDFTIKTDSYMSCSAVTNVKIVNNSNNDYYAIYSGSAGGSGFGPTTNWISSNNEATISTLYGSAVFADGHVSLVNPSTQEFVADFSYKYQQAYSCSNVTNVLIADKTGG